MTLTTQGINRQDGQVRGGVRGRMYRREAESEGGCTGERRSQRQDVQTRGGVRGRMERREAESEAGCTGERRRQRQDVQARGGVRGRMDRRMEITSRRPQGQLV